MNTGEIGKTTGTYKRYQQETGAGKMSGESGDASFAEKLAEQREKKETKAPWQEYDNCRCERKRRKREMEDSYWERRRLQKKRMKKWIKMQQERKRLMDAAYEKAARKEREANLEQLERFLRGERLKTGGYSDRENEVRKAAQALAAYELSLLMTDIGG